MPSLIASPCPDRIRARPTLGRAARAGGDGRGARPGVVGPDLERAAVIVVVARDGPVLARVRRLGHARGRGRAGDVGDRRDVVPVDAVANAQQEAGEQDAEVRRGGGGCGDRGDDVEHAWILGGER